MPSRRRDVDAATVRQLVHDGREADFGEQRPRARVRQHVGQLVGGPVPVDVHVPQPDVGGRGHQLEALAAIAGVDRDGVAGRQADPAQRVRQQVDARPEVPPGGRAALVGEGDLVGPGLDMRAAVEMDEDVLVGHADPPGLKCEVLRRLPFSAGPMRSPADCFICIMFNGSAFVQQPSPGLR